MQANERAVIFDMDGVIILSMDAHWESWERVAARRNATVSYADFLAGFGQTNKEVIPRMFGRPFEPEELERVALEKEDEFCAILAGEIPLAPGVIELLDELREAGFALGVGTSAPPQNLELVLDGANLRSYFSAGIHGSDVTLGKPNPQVFLMAAERLGVAPANCVVIEDAPVGVRAAKAAGMRAVALQTTNTEADLRAAGCDLLLPDLASVNVQRDLL